MKRAAALLLLLASTFGQAQNPNDALWQSLFQNLTPRALGPTTMGGRISDIAVYEKEPRIFYVASASGGLWKTENAGISFTPVFERENTISLGAVAIDPGNPDIVYLGSGESNNRNSTAWGDGMYKSTDGGKTWTNVGLKETFHISRVRVNPKNPNIVFVAAMGKLWGTNPERGIFKSTDAGKTWRKVLYVNDMTGATDLVLDPSNPNTMLAATYQRLRKPYNYLGGGPGSGIWKSTNGGETWRRITKGLPPGDIGRIGLDYFRKNPKAVVAAVEHGVPTKGEGGNYTFDRKLNGIYKSTDGGESWSLIPNSPNPRPFYFSQVRQDPVDEKRIYLPAVNFHYTDDMGKSFKIMQVSLHVDYHALWINPNDNKQMIVGEDGGVGQTRDGGKTWEHLNSLPLAQFYAVTYDNRKPYYVYGGLQDNGCWGGPTQTTRGGVAFWDWYGIGGGDGFHVQVDPNDWTTVYSESQGGAIQRLDQKNGGSRGIQPRPPQGERYRFNWSSPIFLSPFNSKTVYFGGNKLFKSVNRGDTWKVISPDLSRNEPDRQGPRFEGGVTDERTGAETHGTIVTISESPLKQGLIYVGTDDGLVHVTQDDGATWTNLTDNVPGLPKYTWCSRVTASKFSEGRVYATFDGHRNDDRKSYAYVSEDYGKTWKSLSGALPEGDVAYVIKEGEKNPDLLMLGTEVSLWISLDRGQNWSRFRAGGFPTVSVHDLVIQPRELDLIVGTHGRGIYLLNLTGLEEMTAANLEKDAVLARPQAVYLLGRTTGQQGAWDGERIWLSPNTQPGTQIQYYLKADASGDAKFVISDAAGQTVAELTGPAKKGLNVLNWRPGFGRGARPVRAGDYRITMTVGGKDYITGVRVEDVTPSG